METLISRMGIELYVGSLRPISTRSIAGFSGTPVWLGDWPLKYACIHGALIERRSYCLRGLSRPSCGGSPCLGVHSRAANLWRRLAAAMRRPGYHEDSFKLSSQYLLIVTTDGSPKSRLYTKGPPKLTLGVLTGQSLR